EQISDPARMAVLLDRMARHHALLTIEIPGSDEQYTSSIVAVNTPYVLLDELLPSSGHRRLLETRKLQVSGKLEGIDIRFSAALEDVEEQDGMITYRAHLPARLEYGQRRMDFRAHIPIAHPLRVVIAGDRDSVAEGELYDLSRGGAGIVLPGEAPALKPARWYDCAIELPGSDWLFCALEMRHAKDMPAGDRHLIGARFDELSPVQTRLVAHCITRLEREQIRKRVVD
ncbi:MAG: flagellar brake protein, partial [Gammaproteobacteria bacterium]|nr:flagellar brake protein [Gammaproteobacteria bacterium]